MFVIANFTLKQGCLVNEKNIQTYSIAVGIIFYAAIYMYLLFSKSEFLAVFNRFVVYIIGVDLLLSALFFSNKNTKSGIVVHSLDEICDKNGHKKNDFSSLDDSTSGYDGDEEDDEDEDEDNSSDSTSADIQTNPDGDTDLDTESKSNKNEAQHTENLQIVQEKFSTNLETAEKEVDDLDTLVLNNDLVDQLEQISSTAQILETGPKKRGRKPKSALSQP